MEAEELATFEGTFGSRVKVDAAPLIFRQSRIAGHQVAGDELAAGHDNEYRTNLHPRRTLIAPQNADHAAGTQLRFESSTRCTSRPVTRPSFTRTKPAPPW